MLTISSPSFRHGNAIPRQHTAQGGSVAPTLVFGGIPPGTRSLALLVEDPDAPDPAAPQGIFTHWIVVDLPPSTTRLTADIPPAARLGDNDFGMTAYVGPAPAVGRHRYFFRLFALDEAMPHGRIDRAALMATVQGHTIEEAELMGTSEESADAQPSIG
jgi:Raf kinase inhibitor-like YbhB/YbcL family protein